MVLANGMTEPTMSEINGINVITPTARFPIGCYMTVGPKIGILFPGQVLGPKGRAMRSAVEKLTVLLQEFWKSENVEVKASSDNKLLFSKLEEINQPFFDVLREGLKINYRDDIVEWILENIPFDMKILLKVFMVTTGEEVDTDIFRREQLKI
jgi:hypothetical protein